MLPGEADEEAAHERGNGVDVRFQYKRHALGHHVSEDAAADRRDHPKHHRHDIGFFRMRVQAGERARDGKSRQSACVGDHIKKGDHPAVLSGQWHELIQDRNGERRDGRQDQTGGTAKRCRRCDACQHVPDHAAADSGHDGEHRDAEDIHLAGQAGERAGKSEGDRSDDFKKCPCD